MNEETAVLKDEAQCPICKKMTKLVPAPNKEPIYGTEVRYPYLCQHGQHIFWSKRTVNK
jgi:C4-type Zn-finger protein